MAQNIQANAQNSLQTLNQIQSMGNAAPPNMSRISPTLLAAANPAGSTLLSDTRVNLDTANRSAESCRMFSDVQGLRRLQQAQMNNTHFDSGCGWRYKPSSGLIPEVNRAALGTADGPLFGKTEADSMTGGVSWAWGTSQLQTAEKNITKKICNSVLKCENMTLLGRYKDVCGYCKTSGSMIPIEKRGSMSVARFPNDPTLSCEANQIVTNIAKCPPPSAEGFTTQSLDDLANCKPPLTRDCVLLAARAAGCSDRGSFITALSAAPTTGDYDAVLRQNRAFQAYRQTANPSLTPALIKDGSTGVDVALSDFQHMVNNMSSRVPKLQLSAKDLCVKGGEFEKYNFCGEFGPTAVIDANSLECAQKLWLQNGGTRAGKGYPTLAKWQGKTFQALQDHINKLKARIQKGRREGFEDVGAVKVDTDTALDELIGTNSGFKNTIDLEKNDLTRGVEVVYISIVKTPKGNLPIVLGSDARIVGEAPNNMVLPSWSGPSELSMAGFYGGVSPSNTLAMMSMFEIRPETRGSVAFKIEKKGGFVLAQNKNPFERMDMTGNDWGSWKNGPETLQSRDYTLNPNDMNIFVTKYYGTGNDSKFNLQMNLNRTGFVNPNANRANTKDIYVTQSPLAPWMQFEVCSRANEDKGETTGMFDTRWNGYSALVDTKQVSGFGVNSNSVVFQTESRNRETAPGKLAYASFVSNSWWNTRAFFAFTAFKTITLAVRPTAPPAIGERLSIFQHANFAGYSHGIYLRNNGNGSYVFEFENRFDGPTGMSPSSYRKFTAPAQLQKWNFVVLQYLKDRANMGVSDFHLSAATFDELCLNSTRSRFLSNLQIAQRKNLGPLILRNAGLDSSHSGLIALGGTNANYTTSSGLRQFKDQSFIGDVAWVHGFRNFIDNDEQLKKELTQEWERRWPRANLPGETIPNQRVKARECWTNETVSRSPSAPLNQAAMAASSQMFTQNAPRR